MNYTAINIQGNTLSSEILEKIRIEDIRHQDAAAFGLPKNVQIREEIGVAWSAARKYWEAFKLRRDRLKETDTGTSETRQGWMIPFLRELGFELEKANAEIINDKSYAISHRAANLDGFPVHLIGVNQSLDKRAEVGGTRLSPHALLQEYLNNNEHLYGLVSNGKFLRLLRDATRLSKLSYLEFNLEQIMEDELFAEFALLYRTLHSSHMPQKQDAGAESIIEYYHTEALASGSRIRNKLSEAVEDCILKLANSLLKHSANADLQKQIDDKRLAPDEYYLQMLRLVYRVLFLLVIEERNLIFPEKLDEKQLKHRDIFYKYYSVARLTKLAEKSIYIDAYKTDLWQSLLKTFELFVQEKVGQKLSIAPLGSGLFAPKALYVVDDLLLDNKSLLDVIKNLVLFQNESGQLTRVNYADLDVEEFGSVYEGLLEFEPVFNKTSQGYNFSFIAGTGRSTSGSHYTPEELVKPLIEHSLDYLIEERLKEPEKFAPSKAPSPPAGGKGWVGGLKGASRITATEQALLSLKICDVACGSGHILLSAARRVALELARVRTGEDQPAPPEFRKATRDVIKHCIYGVDKNPLAVELCKVALWLEAHNPGEPLSFLDHRIKCGDAIVGLARREELQIGIANEAFKKLTNDDKDIASKLSKANKAERKLREESQVQSQLIYGETDNRVQEAQAEYGAFVKLPESTPQEIERKARAYEKFIAGKGYMWLKQMADAQIAQFFIPKTKESEYALLTDGAYRSILKGTKTWQSQGLAKCTAVGIEKRFFHWFLEFPEVFAPIKSPSLEEGRVRDGSKVGVETGFHCILGNPPFLGDKKLRNAFGGEFLEYVKYSYAPAGVVDLVTYFFRRIFDILKAEGFQSLISTNTIAQGGAREGGLDVITRELKGTINHAVKSMRWPGEAAVEVAVVSIYKGNWAGPFELGVLNKNVKFISSYLDNQENLSNPYTLQRNSGKSFIGNYLQGDGFVLSIQQANEILKNDPKYRDVIFPYLNGHDLNNSPDKKAQRYVINFFNWPLKKYTIEAWSNLNRSVKTSINKKVKENKFIAYAPPNYKGNVAVDYPKCLNILQETIKPEREKKQQDETKNKWWIHARIRTELYKTIQNFQEVIVIARTSKTVSFEVVENNSVFADALVVIGTYWQKSYSILQSEIHKSWAWKYCTTMKADLNYTPSQTFDSYPFMNISKSLIAKGEELKNIKESLCENLDIGSTKLYNFFHFKNLTSDELIIRTSQAKIKCQHSFVQFQHFRKKFSELDQEVLKAYGWTDINLQHDFYAVDYLPENDNVRFTIHPDARKEILKRLLLLNHQYYEEELLAGLHPLEDAEAFYTEKGLPVPEKVKTKSKKFKDNRELYKAGELILASEVNKRGTLSEAEMSRSQGQESLKSKVQGQDSSLGHSELAVRPDTFGDSESAQSKGKSITSEPKSTYQATKSKKLETGLNSVVILRNSKGEERRYELTATGKDGASNNEMFPATYINIVNNNTAQQLLNRKIGFKLKFDGDEWEVVGVN